VYLRFSKAIIFETSWIILGYFVSIVGSILLVKILTKALSTSDYGRLSLALTIGTLVCQVGFSTSMPGISRFYTLSVEKNEIDSFWNSAKDSLIKSTIASIILGVLSLLMLVYLKKTELLFISGLAIFYSVLLSYSSTFSLIQNAARKRKIVSLINAIDSISKILLLYLMLRYLTSTSEKVIVIYILVVLMILFSQNIFLNKLLPEIPNKKDSESFWKNRIYEFSQPFLIFNFFTWFQSNSDRWALEILTTTSNVGLYSVLFQLGYTPITILTGFLSTLISPILYSKSGAADDVVRNNKVKKITWLLIGLIMICGFFAMMVTFLFHTYIFRFLVSKQYLASSFLMPWMILAATIASASQFLSIKIMGDLDTKKLILPKVFTSLISIILTFLGAKYHGLTGVIISIIIFNLVQFLWLAIISNKKI
jgi:O-antigen/teichoic acid export membrane protein